MRQEQITKYIETLYRWISGAELIVAKRLGQAARMLARGAIEPSAAAWHAILAQQLDLMRRELARYLNATTLDMIDEVEGFEEMLMQDGRALALAQLSARRMRDPLRMSYGDLTAPLKAWAQSAVGLDVFLRNIGLIMHRQAIDVYRRLGDEVGFLLASGTLSTEQGAKWLSNKLAKEGVFTFVDRRNREWDMHSYCDMVVRTTARRAHIQGFVQELADRGHDLVYVSDSPHECELCRPWEGQVLSVSGASQKYPSVMDAVMAGLLHPNCTHRLNAYFEGWSKPASEDTQDPEGYEMQQEIRKCERRLRRIRLGLAVDPTNERLLRLQEAWEDRLDELVEEAGEYREPYRERPLPAQVRRAKSLNR